MLCMAWIGLKAPGGAQLLMRAQADLNHKPKGESEGRVGIEEIGRGCREVEDEVERSRMH